MEELCQVLIKTEPQTCRLCGNVDQNSKDALEDSHKQILCSIQKFLYIIVSTDCAGGTFNVCSRCDQRFNEWNQYFEEVHLYQERLQKINHNQLIEPTQSQEVVEDEVFVKAEPKIECPPKKRLSTRSKPAVKKPTNKTNVKPLNPEKKASDFSINDFYDLTCQLCKTKFDDWQLLNEHLIDVHCQKHPTLLCCGIEIPTTQEALFAHINNHTYRIARTFKKKVKRHENAEAQRFPCSQCNKTLRGRKALDKHILLHKSFEERQEMMLQCDICKKYFVHKVSIFLHMKSKHMEDVEPVFCDKCGKGFKTRCQLVDHYKYMHREDSKTKCPECGEVLKISALSSHRLRVHDENKQFCVMCSKEFKNMFYLKAHNKRVHVERNYKCDQCDKSFKILSHLKDHKGSHMAVKRFGCDMCDYMSSDFANTLKHRRLKHPHAPPFEAGTAKQMLTSNK